MFSFDVRLLISFHYVEIVWFLTVLAMNCAVPGSYIVPDVIQRILHDATTVGSNARLRLFQDYRRKL